MGRPPRRLAILRDRGRDFRLDLYGDGVLQQQLESQVARLGLGDLVAFHGWRPKDEVAAELRRSDVFVIASRYDSNPCAVIEALASGVPVVGTAVGGIPEMVTDGMGVARRDRSGARSSPPRSRRRSTVIGIEAASPRRRRTSSARSESAATSQPSTRTHFGDRGERAHGSCSGPRRQPSPARGSASPTPPRCPTIWLAASFASRSATIPTATNGGTGSSGSASRIATGASGSLTSTAGSPRVGPSSAARARAGPRDDRSSSVSATTSTSSRRPSPLDRRCARCGSRCLVTRREPVSARFASSGLESVQRAPSRTAFRQRRRRTRWSGASRSSAGTK